MKNYFINHGFMGSNIENWFPWFKEKIDSDNSLCIIPQYPIDMKHHFYEYWESVLDVYNDMGLINSDSVIIGHSTGSIFSVKYILEHEIKIDKLILVSGFNNFYSGNDNDFHDVIHPTFFIDDMLLSKVKDYASKIICIYGDNDPYIPQSYLHDFATRLGALEVVIKDGGHMNKDAGYTSFEEILKYL